MTGPVIDSVVFCDYVILHGPLDTLAVADRFGITFKEAETFLKALAMAGRLRRRQGRDGVDYWASRSAYQSAAARARAGPSTTTAPIIDPPAEPDAAIAAPGRTRRQAARTVRVGSAGD